MLTRVIMRLVCALSASALAVAGCTTSPEGRNQLKLLPEGQLAEMGQASFTEMKQKMPIVKDPQVNRYVKCVADSITRNIDSGNVPKDWEVVVFDDPSPNAFALPGGKIGVHSGLLKVAKTPSQLAAVLGHEVGHVTAAHGNERVSQTLAAQGGLALASAFLSGQLEGTSRGLVLGALGLGAQYGVLLPYGRTQETEADVIGLRLMARAGFNPEESVTLWQNMAAAGGGQPPEFLSTHPSHETRMETLRNHIPEAKQVGQNAEAPQCRIG